MENNHIIDRKVRFGQTKSLKIFLFHRSARLGFFLVIDLIFCRKSYTKWMNRRRLHETTFAEWIVWRKW